MKDDRVSLRSILESIGKIERYTHGGRSAFLESDLIQDAVIRQFQVIGEAVKELSPGTRSSKPEVPWKLVAGFRDVLIHNYLGIDIAEVWNRVELDLPLLKSSVQELATSLDR